MENTTNYTVYFWDDNRDPIAIAHTTYFIDAIRLAKAMPNCDIIDFESGEVLRTYEHGELVYDA